MYDICIAATHSDWGMGVIISRPVWSILVGGQVVDFLPDNKDFSILVPLDEIEVH